MDHDCKQEDKINKLCEFKGGTEAKLDNIDRSITLVMTNHIPHIYKELKRLAGRPSWIVTFIMLTLSSIVTALITVLLRR